MKINCIISILFLIKHNFILSRLSSVQKGEAQPSNNISERLITIIVFVILFEFVVDEEYFVLYIRKRGKKGEARRAEQ